MFSSFFLTLTGLSSSSSRLTLDATLESALMTFDDELGPLLPVVFVEITGSIVELGVTNFKYHTHIRTDYVMCWITLTYHCQCLCCCWQRLACCCYALANWTLNREYHPMEAHIPGTISLNSNLSMWKFQSINCIHINRIGESTFSNIYVIKTIKMQLNLLQCWLSSSPLRLSLVLSSSSVFDNVCRLCFMRRFWNHTFTCVRLKTETEQMDKIQIT